ncbi:hypothetical protein DL96DRAFT_1706998 [Flagelloscypha sp. PMI_526]|nr:hypothetical protein DL96DRAFT_1706998 [Flagelloscypha sp. PMI_526]
MASSRKASFKMPPIKESQETRRTRLLAEQKQRRQRLLESSRHIEAFSSLSLGDSDGDEDDSPQIAREGVSAFASMVQPSVNNKAKKKKHKNSSMNKWADKCMYAELLELSNNSQSFGDGLPPDLETAWIAIAPVPSGKRCLAVTHGSSGPTGMIANTTLKSRLVGRTLIPSFPSALPPMTVLDCILDSNWRQNGILHVLDVIKWKGQDIGDSDASFRMWWRDARLSETAPLPPKVVYSQDGSQRQYRFKYPTLLSPIPWHSGLTHTSLLSTVIPAAKSTQKISNLVPALDGTMAMDIGVNESLVVQNCEIASDGLLLYVAEASYEHGTSPLSIWVPLSNNEEDGMLDAVGPLESFALLLQSRLQMDTLKEEDADMEM